MTDQPEHITQLLNALSDESAQPILRRPPDELFSLVYAHLRNIARQRLRDRRTGHTLGATALVHEAWLKLTAPRPT